MPAHALSDDEHHLLQLMFGGLSDEQIAGRLFVSVRTMRRQLRNLMENAGAVNRFALGAIAAHHRWIDPT